MKWQQKASTWPVKQKHVLHAVAECECPRKIMVNLQYRGGFSPEEWWQQKHQCPPSWAVVEIWGLVLGFCPKAVLAERWRRGAKLLCVLGCFSSLSPVSSNALLSWARMIYPKPYKRSQESRGLYPFLAFRLKLELIKIKIKNKIRYHLKESSSSSVAMNAAMPGTSAPGMETSDSRRFFL